tara:strand:+ start:35072 stop:35491 length:420 start_codon:yes stop_codon:yes gene_type:complete
MEWLVLNGWHIVTFDYPKSGIGHMLHPNSIDKTEKNKNGIIPDIIATKDNIAVFFENKDRFYELDFDKLFEIKTQNNFSDSLSQLLSGYSISKIVYGIGIPEEKKHIEKSIKQLDKIDFLITTDDNKNVKVHFDIENVF